MYVLVSRVLQFDAAACCCVSKYSTSSDLKCSSCVSNLVATVNLRWAAACEILGVTIVGATVLCFKLRARAARTNRTLNSTIVTGRMHVVGIGFEGRTTDISSAFN
jgi:hypothetical protein